MNRVRARIAWTLAPMLVWTAHFLALYIGASLICALSPASAQATLLGWGGAGATVIALAVVALAARAAARPRDENVPGQAFLRSIGLLLAALAALAIGMNAFMLIAPHPCH